MQQYAITAEPQLMKEVDKVIKETGLYSSRNDFVRESIRARLYEIERKESLALEIRKIRKEWEEELMKKANGNKKKAFELFKKEIEEEAKKDIYQNITIKSQ